MATSMPRNPQHRVGAFVDVQNLFYAAKLMHQSKVDYAKLARELAAGRQLVKSVAYIVQRPDVDNRSFCDALGRLGYEIRSKSIRGNWNVGLAIDAVLAVPKVDTIVIVSGDAAFEALAKAVRSLGCRFELMAFEGSVSRELVAASDAFYPITDAIMFKEKKFEGLTQRPAAPQPPVLRTDGLTPPVPLDEEESEVGNH